jgi:hypothetical protein
MHRMHPCTQLEESKNAFFMTMLRYATLLTPAPNRTQRIACLIYLRQ